MYSRIVQFTSYIHEVEFTNNNFFGMEYNYQLFRIPVHFTNNYSSQLLTTTVINLHNFVDYFIK